MSTPPPEFDTTTDNEITMDPEATSAADAEWLAELRAKAKAGNQSMGEILADAPQPADRVAPPVPAAAPAATPERIDEPTIAPDDDVMDEIRAAVAEARAPVAPPAEPSSAPAPVPAERVPTPTSASTPRSLRPPEPAPARERTSSASHEARVLAGPLTAPTTSAPTERWEPPQRLAPVVEVAKPTLNAKSTTGHRSRALLSLGVAALVIIVVLLAIILRGSDAAPEIVPDGSIPGLDVERDADPELVPAPEPGE